MPTETTTVPPHLSPSSIPPPRRRRSVTPWVVAGTVVALVGAVLGLAGGGPSKGSAGASRAGVESVGSIDGQSTARGAAPAPGVDVDGVPLDQSGDTTEVDQTGDTPDVDEPQPEAPVEVLPATLSVTPDPVHLKAGVYAGAITVANVGDEPMHWSAQTKPWVSLSDTTGDLGAHGENVIAFTVDESHVEPGGFAFKIKVWGDGGTEYVDVTGAKPVDEII